MCEVYVPKYRLIQDAKPHYVYTIEVLGNSIQQTIEKRYSAFHALHREVSKYYLVLLDWGVGIIAKLRCTIILYYLSGKEFKILIAGNGHPF